MSETRPLIVAGPISRGSSAPSAMAATFGPATAGEAAGAGAAAAGFPGFCFADCAPIGATRHTTAKTNIRTRFDMVNLRGAIVRREDIGSSSSITVAGERGWQAAGSPASAVGGATREGHRLSPQAGAGPSTTWTRLRPACFAS